MQDADDEHRVRGVDVDIDGLGLTGVPPAVAVGVVLGQQGVEDRVVTAVGGQCRIPARLVPGVWEVEAPVGREGVHGLEQLDGLLLGPRRLLTAREGLGILHQSGAVV